jgi:hypothetical protein
VTPKQETSLSDSQVRNSTCFPHQGANIEPDYFLLRVWEQSFSVCAHAGRRTKSHAPVPMHAGSELAAAVVTTY